MIHKISQAKLYYTLIYEQMKMSPAAKTYLISGYPRSMRDVVEYSEKVENMLYLIKFHNL